MNKSTFVSPSNCFLTSLMLLMVSAGMASTYTVFRKRLDADGHVMLNSNGRPLVEVDQWASFWNGWPSNLPFVAAIFLLILGVVLWIRSRINVRFRK